MADSLALRTARSHVDSFKDESKRVIEEHYEAMDCWDCEAFLQLGIDAFDWVMRVDQGVRMAIFKGSLEYDQELDLAIRTLCEGWLGPCQRAEQWVETQRKRGYTIPNLERFRECHREMLAIVRAFKEHDSNTAPFPAVVAGLCDEAVQEHLDGQTAEFV